MLTLPARHPVTRAGGVLGDGFEVLNRWHTMLGVAPHRSLAMHTLDPALVPLAILLAFIAAAIAAAWWRKRQD